MKSGIYKIHNTISEKSYIGQSVDIKRRLIKHRNELSKGTHQNIHLQNAWNKYGADSFLFEIIEKCSIDDLDEREIFYIDQLKTNDRRYGYNIFSGGQATHDCPEEVKTKISLKNKGKSKPWTDAHKAAASKNWHNIHKPLPEETRKKAILKRKDRLSLDGENNGNAIFSDKQAEIYILEMLNGETPYIIAKRDNVSLNSLLNLYENRSYRHILTDRREELRNRCSTEFNKKVEKCIALYKSGVSKNQIAKTLHMSRNTISRVVKAVV